MTTRVCRTAAALLVLALCAPTPLMSALRAADARTETRAASAAPLMYVENVGQFAPGDRFQARVGDQVLWLAEDALWLTILPPAIEARGAESVSQYPAPSSGPSTPGVNLKLSFLDANPHPVLEPADRLTTHVSYFLGHDASQWHPDVPVWSSVRYRDMYPGIDLVLGGTTAGWQPYLDVQPNADLGQVRLRLDGAEGLTADGQGIHVVTPWAVYDLPLLIVHGATPDLLDAPAASGNQVSSPFARIGAVAPHQMQPHNGEHDLIFSTYLGGTDSDTPAGLVVVNGSSYIAGSTRSTDFPATPGVFQSECAGGYVFHCDDAVVAKFSPDGSRLIYATYLGGSANDEAQSLAVNSSGAAYLVGFTGSNNFPTTPGAYSATYHGDDAFVTQIGPDGTRLVYSTFLGGSGRDCIAGASCAVALDSTGAAYVAGDTLSDDFPTTPGVFQPGCHGCAWGEGDAFVSKLTPDGSALAYSTFLGGYGGEMATGIAVDASGAAYVTGGTDSWDFPTTPGAFQPGLHGGTTPVFQDSWVTKLNTQGTSLDYSTYLGGSGNECYYALCRIAVNAQGNAFVVGVTGSSDFPTTPGAFDDTFGGGSDAFVTQLSADGSTLVYSTFLGGSANDGGIGITLDAAGTAYVTGYTDSAEFPTTPDAFQPVYPGNRSVFVTQLDPTGSAIGYSTFLGGNALAWGWSIAVDAAGAMYVFGFTAASDFPTTPGAYDRIYNGGYDLFLARLAPQMEPEIYLPLAAHNAEPTPKSKWQ